MRKAAPEVLESDSEGSEADASMHGAATDAESEPLTRPRNVSSVATFKRGNAEAGLAGADVVVKATYRIAGVHQAFIEPHVTLVRPEPGGRVTIVAPTHEPLAPPNESAT